MIGMALLVILGAMGCGMFGYLLLAMPAYALRERDPFIGWMSGFLWLVAITVGCLVAGV